jgi:hypothetical protein
MNEDQTKPPEQVGMTRERLAEHIVKLAKHPRFKVMPPSGKSFIFGWPGPVPKQ